MLRSLLLLVRGLCGRRRNCRARMNGGRPCALAPEREDRQLHNPAAKTESFIRGRSPDVYATASYGSARVAYNIVATERTCLDRKSTRLNSSHLGISYAVFCLK